MTARLVVLALLLMACAGDAAPARTPNRPPVPGAFEVATNEFTPVTLDVVSVAKDAKGQFISIRSADAGAGRVAIETNQTLRYTPAAPGTVTVVYVLVDNYGAAASGTATVTVTAGEAVQIVSFAASPDIVVAGSPATLRWSASSADACTIEPDVGDVPAAGSQAVTPVVPTRYTLTCDGPGGPVARSAEVFPDGDLDGDGRADAFEARVGTSAMDHDSDDDGLPDNVEDANGNGVVEPGETDPRVPASDGVHCDYLREDNDGDGLTPPAACRARAVLAAGVAHSCMILPTGAVRCWGYNSQGQLGHGGTEVIGDDETPASAGDVPLGGKAVQLALGASHSCALLVTGAVRCWGGSSYGQIGYGYERAAEDALTPDVAGDVDVGGTVIKLVAGYSHTCALLTTGAVRCWGRGINGVLGYGNGADIGDDETPASAGDVSLGGAATDLDAGDMHTCAVLGGGQLRCWGSGNDGRLGYGNTNTIGDDELPSSAGPLNLGGYKALEVAAGESSTCVRLEAGVRCWGSGGYGRLGNLSTAAYGDEPGETPAAQIDVSIGGAVVQLSSAGAHTCALLAGGALRCWGYNNYGQLGYGHGNAVGDDETPASAGDVRIGGEVLQVAAAGYHTCVVLNYGVVRCWGVGQQGRLGYMFYSNMGDQPGELPEVMLDVPYR